MFFELKPQFFRKCSFFIYLKNSVRRNIKKVKKTKFSTIKKQKKMFFFEFFFYKTLFLNYLKISSLKIRVLGVYLV